MHRQGITCLAVLCSFKMNQILDLTISVEFKCIVEQTTRLCNRFVFYKKKYENLSDIHSKQYNLTIHELFKYEVLKFFSEIAITPLEKILLNDLFFFVNLFRNTKRSANQLFKLEK